MSEFQEVMREWVRVRKATASSAEENVLSVYPLEEYDNDLIANIEKNVMTWAAEHPEPVYPSVAEYLEQLGISIRRDGMMEADFFKANEPMSETLAKKLGIEPKEAKE